MSEEMIEATVKVPRSKLARLYELVGKLNEEEAPQNEEGEEGHVEWTKRDSALAVEHWKKLSPPAQQMYGLLMLSPGKKFSGEEIAKKLGLQSGAFGTAGLLAWPGRYAIKVGRKLPISWEQLPNSVSHYWMTAEVAQLFVKAKDANAKP